MADTRAYLAGVADVDLFAGSDLILQAKTLTDSSVSISVTAEEIRGGKGAQLIGRYFHTTTFTVELTDVLFQLQYVALNVGAEIDATGEHGGELVTEEVVAADNALAIAGTAHDFMGLGVIGWYKLPDDEDWTMFTFGADNKTSTGATVVNDTLYCVKYMNTADADTITVSADFIPDEVTMVMKADLFKAARNESGVTSTSSKIGVAQIEVPRFQLNGSIDLTMSSTGASSTPLSGQALSTSDGTEGCDGNGYYSRIKKIIFAGDWKDNLTSLAAVPSSITVAKDQTTTLNIYGVFSGGGSSRLIAPADLEYEATPTGIATVSNGNVYAGSTAQSGTITVTVKDTEVSLEVPIEVTE